MRRSPLLITGGPAAGKTTTALQLASTVTRAAVIDVDDIRQLVVAGHAAPWDGEEGARQQRLGVENACALAQRFVLASIDVLIADVVDGSTIGLYRRLLPGLHIVRLRLTLEEARRRASMRPLHLTEQEFHALHAQEAADLPVDLTIDVTLLSVREQVDAVRDCWDRRRSD